MTTIHETAIIDSSVELGLGVEVGPYTVIQGDVTIGDHCVIGPHVVISGKTTLGAHNKIFQFASVGEDPQDKKYAGEPTQLVVGDHNVIRENCTIHRGTAQDAGITQIGSHNLLMAYSHVAHDCMLGDHIVLANSATLAGHVTLGDHVILGGLSAIHQFCRVGAHAFAKGGSLVTQDIPPYLMVAGEQARPFGLNSEGLKRRGFSQDSIQILKRAYKILYRQGHRLEDALAAISEEANGDQAVLDFIDFIKASQRGIVRP